MKLTAIVVATACLLSACGGGTAGEAGTSLIGSGSTSSGASGSTSSSNLGNLTSSNYQIVGNAAMAAAYDAAVMSNLSQFVVSTLDPDASKIATNTKIVACTVGGSVSLVATDINSDGALDYGDSIVATFSDCVLSSNQQAVTGKWIFSAQNIYANGVGGINSAGFSVNVSQLSTTHSTQSGVFDLTYTPTQIDLNYLSYSATHENQNAVYAFSTVAPFNVASITINGNITLSSTSYQVSTKLTTLGYGDGYLSSGSLLAVDSVNSYVSLFPMQNEFIGDLYLDGSTTTTANYTKAVSAVL